MGELRRTVDSEARRQARRLRRCDDDAKRLHARVLAIQGAATSQRRVALAARAEMEQSLHDHEHTMMAKERAMETLLAGHAASHADQLMACHDADGRAVAAKVRLSDGACFVVMSAAGGVARRGPRDV